MSSSAAGLGFAFLKSSKSGKQILPPPASGTGGKFPSFSPLSGAPSANSPRMDRSEGDWRGPGQSHAFTHPSAFPLGHLMAEVDVKTVLFYAWKEGRR